MGMLSILGFVRSGARFAGKNLAAMTGLGKAVDRE
jgi:hypothetical protein